MCRKNACIFCLLLICQLLTAIYLPEAVAQDSAEVQTETLLGRIFSSPVTWTIILIFLFASINYAIELFNKDKILKKLLKKYVVFEMTNGVRYRGTMRLEANGIEIISEESRQRGRAPSYILTDTERDGIAAYIRYLDSMNERERLERDWDLDRVYHPRFPTRVRRKIRNFGIALKNSVKKTVEMIWGQIKKSTSFRAVAAKQGEVSAEGEVEDMRKELWEYAMEESYERLIERLVGTRVKFRVTYAQDRVREYIAVLKEYNDKHMYLMDVKRPDDLGYEDEWSDVTLDIASNNVNVRDERGMRSRIEGNHLILENNAPYEIQLWGLTYQRDAETDTHDWKWNFRIPAFSVQQIHLQPSPKDHNVDPFVRVAIQEQRTHEYFKQLHLKFRSFREADVVFPRKYCKIIESAERYQPELLDLGVLTESILAAKETKDIAITDKDGKPIKDINIIHGYVTNVNEDRIDLKSIDQSYGRRWSVEHAFHRLDDKLRKVGPVSIKVLPRYRARMVTQVVLAGEIGENRSEQEVFSPLVYRPVAPRIRPDKKPELPFKVLALTGNITAEEFPVLEQFGHVHNRRVIYEQVKDLRTDKIARTHLLWIGHGEIYKDGYRLNIDSEHRIKNFVSRGGIVVVSGQDISKMRRRRQSVGWIPEPLIGVEHEETLEFTPTRDGKKSRLFQSPHKIESGQIKLDDMWLDQLNRYTLLAKANGGAEAAILLLRFQKGLYIITSLKNEAESDAQINQAMMENLLYFSARWFDRQKHSHLYYTYS